MKTVAVIPIKTRSTRVVGKNLRKFNPLMRQSDELELMKNDKEEFISALKNNYNK